MKRTSKKNMPKIIVTVDFAENPVLQDQIYKLSKKYKFKIIETHHMHWVQNIRIIW